VGGANSWASGGCACDAGGVPRTLPPTLPAVPPGTRVVVLVEGVSDGRALAALATRRGVGLAAGRVEVVPMGGAGNAAGALQRYGPPGAALPVAGLVDAGEEADVRRSLVRAGLAPGVPGDPAGPALPGVGGAGLASTGFFVCHRDLEDELIRAAGTGAVERVIAAQGELRALRTLQKQAAWRGRPVAEQLRRFMGAKAGRKERYAGLLVDALDLDRVPRPLDALLRHVAALGDGTPTPRSGRQVATGSSAAEPEA
jgi:hypothetical protein